MITALLLLGASAVAQTSAPAAPAPAAPTPRAGQGAPGPQAPADGPQAALAQQDALLKQNGISDAGVATMRKSFESVLATRETYAQREEAGAKALADAFQSNPVDVNKIASAMKANDALAQERLSNRTNATIGALRELSPADRVIVAKIMAAAQRGGPVPVAPPAPQSSQPAQAPAAN